MENQKNNKTSKPKLLTCPKDEEGRHAGGNEGGNEGSSKKSVKPDRK